MLSLYELCCDLIAVQLFSSLDSSLSTFPLVCDPTSLRMSVKRFPTGFSLQWSVRHKLTDMNSSIEDRLIAIFDNFGLLLYRLPLSNSVRKSLGSALARHSLTLAIKSSALDFVMERFGVENSADCKFSDIQRFGDWTDGYDLQIISFISTCSSKDSGEEKSRLVFSIRSTLSEARDSQRTN